SLRSRLPRPPRSTLLPYTTLFRSEKDQHEGQGRGEELMSALEHCYISAQGFPEADCSSRTHYARGRARTSHASGTNAASHNERRSEEHTSELQSRENLVCRLLLEK